MNNQLEKLEELNKLNNSGQITDAEYKVLLSDILQTKTENDIKPLISKSKNIKFDNNEILKKINQAGSNVIIIYYLIVFEIIFQQLYNLLMDVKIKYYYKSLGSLNLYQESNFITDYILDMKSIDSIIEYLKNVNEIYYFIQLILSIIFMNSFWNIGKNLKNI